MANMKRDKNGLTLEEFLASYDVTQYERPSVAADIAVFTLVENAGQCDLAVLLIRRGCHPHIGEWALPGGFVNMDEELVDAAKRELNEETGLTDIALRPFGMFGGVDRDPRTRVISAGFYGVAPMNALSPNAGDDAADAGLYVIETSLEAGSAPADVYRMTLFGRRILSARAKLRYDMLGAQPEQIPGGDLASDHSLELFTALLALNAQPRERMTRILCLGRPEFEALAEDALNRALGALPRSL